MPTRPRKVIKAPDSMAAAISRRVPHDGTAMVGMGSVCVVEPSQVGVLTRDGQTFDVLGPGRHALTPSELPLLAGSLNGRPTRRAPFEAAVHFVSQRVYTGMKWGTPEPLTFRDGALGAVRLRAFGVYTIRVADATLFLNTVTGAQDTLTTRQLEEYLQGLIVSRLDDLLEERVKTLSELPTLYSELATEVRLELKQDFGRSGIDLIDFFITSVVPTGEVQPAAPGNSGEAGSESNTSGRPRHRTDRSPAGSEVGTGRGTETDIGVGVGEGVGLILPQAFHERTGRRSEAACPQCGNPRSVTKTCGDCREALPRGANFCPRCGADQRGRRTTVRSPRRRRSG